MKKKIAMTLIWGINLSSQLLLQPLYYQISMNSKSFSGFACLAACTDLSTWVNCYHSLEVRNSNISLRPVIDKDPSSYIT